MADTIAEAYLLNKNNTEKNVIYRNLISGDFAMYDIARNIWNGKLDFRDTLLHTAENTMQIAAS